MCAQALEAGARKCTHCDAFQDVRECSSCHMPTPVQSSRCAYCKVVEDGKPCRVCGASLSKTAVRCGECTSFQNLRRFLPASQVTLALILSIISVLSAVIPPIYRYLANHSQTNIRVLGVRDYQENTQVPEKTIAVLAANRGKRTSFIRSATLRFSGGSIPTVLRVRNIVDQAVQPEKNVVLYLTADTMSGMTPAEVYAWLERRGAATVVVNIDEIDRDGNVLPVSRTHVLNSNFLNEWIESHVQRP